MWRRHGRWWRYGWRHVAFTRHQNCNGAYRRFSSTQYPNTESKQSCRHTVSGTPRSYRATPKSVPQQHDQQQGRGASSRPAGRHHHSALHGDTGRDTGLFTLSAFYLAIMPIRYPVLRRPNNLNYRRVSSTASLASRAAGLLTVALVENLLPQTNIVWRHFH